MPFYYHNHDREAPNTFVERYRKVYRPTGFKRGYNFPLWIILGGAALGFCASRAEYLDVRGTYAQAKLVTGDWYYQSSGHNYVGIVMHLAAVVPIGFLIPWQFLPIVRHKAIWFHRINGYVLILLLLFANTGAFMIARRGLGGDLSAQVAVGILGVSTTMSLILAYWNIKVLQIDQHRAWMLRAWVYAFTIISQRLIQLAAYKIVSDIGSYYFPFPCRVIASIYQGLGIPIPASQIYPICVDPSATAAVHVDYWSKTNPVEIGAAVNITFGMTAVLAFFIHAVAVELYLHLTPGEAARLKRVSYERQLQRGWLNAGSSGTSADRWGDAEPFDYKDADLKARPTDIEGASDSDLATPPLEHVAEK